MGKNVTWLVPLRSFLLCFVAFCTSSKICLPFTRRLIQVGAVLDCFFFQYGRYLSDGRGLRSVHDLRLESGGHSIYIAPFIATLTTFFFVSGDSAFLNDNFIQSLDAYGQPRPTNLCESERIWGHRNPFLALAHLPEDCLRAKLAR